MPYQLVVTARSSGNHPAAPELAVATGGFTFNANLNTPAGTTLATNSTRALLDIGRALRASGASLDALYELRYHPSMMTGAVCTVRDMLRANPLDAMPT